MTEARRYISKLDKKMAKNRRCNTIYRTRKLHEAPPNPLFNSSLCSMKIV